MRSREYRMGYGFIAIWIIGFLIFTLQPLCYSIYLSFNNVLITAEGIENTYVGFGNYMDAFLRDINFTKYLTDFLVDLILTLPSVLVFSLIISLLLNLKNKATGVIRLIFFLPVILMTDSVIDQLTKQNAFTLTGLNEYGFIYFIGANLNGTLSSLLLSLMSNMVLVLWYTGVQSLIFLAALQKIDGAVYEAARIDGASPWESFWKITLPTLKPMILVNLVYTLVTLSTFSLNEVSVHISDQLFDQRTGFGYASALAWIYFLILAVILGVCVFLFTREPKRR